LSGDGLKSRLFGIIKGDLGDEELTDTIMEDLSACWTVVTAGTEEDHFRELGVDDGNERPACVVGTMMEDSRVLSAMTPNCDLLDRHDDVTCPDGFARFTVGVPKRVSDWLVCVIGTD